MASTATTHATSSRRSLAVREAIWFYIFISPWLVGFILFTAGPILPKWVGLANYTLMWVDPLFWKSLTVTIYYTFVSVPLSVAFATFIALLLNEKLPGVSIWRTVYYLPAIVSGVPVAVMWWLLFNSQFGMINGVLWDPFGIIGPRWLSDPPWVMPAFIVMSLWSFGGPMLIYLAAIQGVPTHLYESAQLDGANIFQQIWHITIPSITPVIFFNGIMAIIASFQVFTNSFVITQGGPNYASYFFVLHIYNNAFTYIANMGYADALSWVLFVVMLIFTYLAFRSSSAWVHYETEAGGVK
jgi:multiple sugar transport system permease protein